MFQILGWSRPCPVPAMPTQLDDHVTNFKHTNAYQYLDEIYRKGEYLMKVTALTSDGVLLTCGGFGNLQCLAFDMDTNSWQLHSSLDTGKIHYILDLI